MTNIDHAAQLGRRRSAMQKKGVNAMAKDPVCGMDVDEKTAAGKSEYKGQVYYFCSPGCKQTFDKDPAKFSSKESGSAQHGHH